MLGYRVSDSEPGVGAFCVPSFAEQQMQHQQQQKFSGTFTPEKQPRTSFLHQSLPNVAEGANLPGNALEYLRFMGIEPPKWGADSGATAPATSRGDEQGAIQQSRPWRTSETNVLKLAMTWTQQEDDMLKSLVALHGVKKWSLIAEIIKTKGSKQCRRRWTNCLGMELKKCGWSPEEDNVLMTAHKKLGNKWTEIAQIVGGRSDNAVKNRYATLVKRGYSLADPQDSAKATRANQGLPELEIPKPTSAPESDDEGGDDDDVVEEVKDRDAPKVHATYSVPMSPCTPVAFDRLKLAHNSAPHMACGPAMMFRSKVSLTDVKAAAPAPPETAFAMVYPRDLRATLQLLEGETPPVSGDSLEAEVDPSAGAIAGPGAWSALLTDENPWDCSPSASFSVAEGPPGSFSRLSASRNGSRSQGLPPLPVPSGGSAPSLPRFPPGVRSMLLPKSSGEGPPQCSRSMRRQLSIGQPVRSTTSTGHLGQSMARLAKANSFNGASRKDPGEPCSGSASGPQLGERNRSQGSSELGVVSRGASESGRQKRVSENNLDDIEFRISKQRFPISELCPSQTCKEVVVKDSVQVSCRGDIDPLEIMLESHCSPMLDQVKTDLQPSQQQPQAQMNGSFFTPSPQQQPPSPRQSSLNGSCCAPSPPPSITTWQMEPMLQPCMQQLTISPPRKRETLEERIQKLPAFSLPQFQPAVQPAIQPTAQPVVQPVVQPMMQPAAQAEVQAAAPMPVEKPDKEPSTQGLDPEPLNNSSLSEVQGHSRKASAQLSLMLPSDEIMAYATWNSPNVPTFGSDVSIPCWDAPDVLSMGASDTPRFSP